VQYGSPPHAARRARLDRLEARALRAARHRPLEWRELAHAIMADAVLRTRLHARFSAAFTRQIAAASELTSNEAEITGDESIHAARSLFAGGELPPARLRTSLVRGSTAEWLAPVLSRHVDAFVAALRSSRDDDVSARLVRYLPPAERASLLSAMLPRHVGLALTLVRAMRAIRGAAALNAPFAAERAGARTDAIWGAVFDVALRTPPDTVRADDLIAMTIDRVASDLSLTSPGFRQALLAVCQRRARRHARFAVLAELLAEPMDSPRELATGATGVRIPETETTSAASAVGNTVVALAARVARQRHAAGPINTLRHLLRFGERHTPSLSVNARLTMDDLERARRTCPAEWRELARDIAADALMRARLHARLPLRIADALTADLPAAESFSANDATSNVIVARAATRLAEGVPSRTLGADAIARPTTVSSQAEADADTPSVADIVALLSAGLLPAGANEEALIAGSTHAWIAPLLDAVHVAALQRACQTTGAANPTAVVASLVRYLPVKSLNALIAAVLPDQAGFVDTYLRAAELSDARWTDSAPFDALAEAWRSALLHVLATPREAFTSRSFVASVTAQTAHALGVDVSAYREALHAETERHSTRAPRFAPLAEILATMTATGGSTPTRAARHSRDERDVAAALWPPRRRTTRAERQDPLVAFRQVLQYGASVTTRTYDPVLFEAQLARARRTRPAEWRALARATANDPLMRARLVTRFSPRLVRRVLESLLTTGATNARRLAMRIAALLAMEADVSRATHEHMSQREMTRLWRRLARESLLAVAGRQEDPARLDSVALAREILRRAAAVKNIPLPVLLAKLRARVWASRLFGAAADAELLEIFSALERETRSRAHNAPAWTYATSSVANDDAPDDPVHVDDAGLVLLWPLFAHYFEMIGLATGGRFRSDDAAERAVLLLRFLATGSADAPEPALALDKLLCGVADEVPVPRRIDVTELESASAMELLHVVTQRWLPLRNTSVAGLRESFLLREGRLVQREDGWLLTVATAPFDMLLDSLPWSLTPVRLPWMTGLLHVKWRR
jgi:hypothetical protein